MPINIYHTYALCLQKKNQFVFNTQMENLNVTRYDKGVAKCPFNPHANITTLMTENGQMFIGSPTDFSGSDPAILRVDVSQVSVISYYLSFINLIEIKYIPT